MFNLSIDENNFLCSDSAKGKEIDFSLRNKVLHLFDKSILTFYKRKFVFRNLREISTWMNVFAFLLRDFWDIKEIDKEAFVCWLSIYQEFDEKKWKNQVYFYGFDKENLKLLDSIFSKMDIWIKIFQEQSFCWIDWNIPSFEQIHEKIFSWVEKFQFEKIASFLFWLSLIYGDFDIKDDLLHSVKINIPLLGSLFWKEKIFLFLFDGLWDNYILNKIDFLSQKVGFLCQIVILDEEILQSFVNFLEKLGIVNLGNWKKERIVSFSKGIEKFVEQNWSFESELEKYWQKWILKVWKK